MEIIDKNFKYFDSQQEDEKVILVVRKHIVSLFNTFGIAGFFYLIGFLMVFILPVAIPSAVAGFSYNIYVLIVSLLFTFTTIFVFNAWVMHYLTVCILTNEHFVDIEQLGLFSRKISSLSLDKIQDTSAFQAGLIHTLLNLGTLEVQTAGEAPNFVIPNVPDPNRISQTIMETEENFARNNGIRSDGQPEKVSCIEHSESPAEQEPNIEFPDQNQ